MDDSYTSPELALLWDAERYYTMYARSTKRSTDFRQAIEHLRMREHFSKQVQHIKDVRRTLKKKNVEVQTDDFTLGTDAPEDYDYKDSHITAAARIRATKSLVTDSPEEINKQAAIIKAQMRFQIIQLIKWSNECTNRTRLDADDFGSAPHFTIQLYEDVLKRGNGDIGAGAAEMLDDIDAELQLVRKNQTPTKRQKARTVEKQSNAPRKARPLHGAQTVRPSIARKQNAAAPSIARKQNTTTKIHTSPIAVVDAKAISKITHTAAVNLAASGIYAQVPITIDDNRDTLGHYASWIVSVIIPRNEMNILKRRLFTVMIHPSNNIVTLMNIIIHICADASSNLTQCVALNIAFPADLRMMIIDRYLREIVPSELQEQDKIFLKYYKEPSETIKTYLETMGFDSLHGTVASKIASTYFESRSVWEGYIMKVLDIDSQGISETTSKLKSVDNTRLPSWAMGDVEVSWPSFSTLAYGNRKNLEIAQGKLVDILLNETFAKFAYGPRTSPPPGHVVYEMVRAILTSMNTAELSSMTAEALQVMIGNNQADDTTVEAVRTIVDNMSIAFCERWYMENRDLVVDPVVFLKFGFNKKLTRELIENQYTHFHFVTLQYYEFAREHLADGVELRDYQRDIVIWGILQELFQVRSHAGARGMLIALPPGLGKTFLLLVLRMFKKWLGHRLVKLYGTRAGLPLPSIPPRSHRNQDVMGNNDYEMETDDISSADEEGMGDTTEGVINYQFDQLKGSSKTLIIAPGAANQAWIKDARKLFREGFGPRMYHFQRKPVGRKKEVPDPNDDPESLAALRNRDKKTEYYLDVCILPGETAEYIREKRREIAEKNITVKSDEVDIILVSLGLFSREDPPEDFYVDGISFDCIGIDESQMTNNRWTLRYKNIQRIKRRTTYCLSGTPITTSLGNLTTTFRLLGYKAKKDVYMDKIVSKYQNARNKFKETAHRKKPPLDPDVKIIDKPASSFPGAVKRFDIDIARAARESHYFQYLYRRATYQTVHNEYKPGAGKIKVIGIHAVVPLLYTQKWMDNRKPTEAEIHGIRGNYPSERKWGGDTPGATWAVLYKLNSLPEYEINALLFKDSNLCASFMRGVASAGVKNQTQLQSELLGVDHVAAPNKSMFDQFRNELDALETNENEDGDNIFGVETDIDGNINTENPLIILAPSLIVPDDSKGKKKKRVARHKLKPFQKALHSNIAAFTYLRMLRMGVYSLHLIEYRQIVQLFKSIFDARSQHAPARKPDNQTGVNKTVQNNVLGGIQMDDLAGYLGTFQPISSALLTYELSYRLSGPDRLTELIKDEDTERTAFFEQIADFFTKPRADDPDGLGAKMWKCIQKIKPITDETSDAISVSARMITTLFYINEFVNHMHWLNRGAKLNQPIRIKSKIVIFSADPQVLALLGLHMRQVFGVLQHGEDIPDDRKANPEKWPTWRYAHYERNLTDKKRAEIVEEFNKGDELNVVLATYGVGGVGLNMQGGNVVIQMDRPWVESTVEQSKNRVYRTGQEKDVFIITLTSVFTNYSNPALGPVVSEERRNAVVDTNFLGNIDKEHIAHANVFTAKNPTIVSLLIVPTAVSEDQTYWTIDHYVAAARAKRKKDEEDFNEMVNSHLIAKEGTLFSGLVSQITPSIKAFNDAMKHVQGGNV